MSVPTVADSSPDAAETFSLALASPRQATLGTPKKAKATISAH